MKKLRLFFVLFIATFSLSAQDLSQIDNVIQRINLSIQNRSNIKSFVKTNDGKFLPFEEAKENSESIQVIYSVLLSKNGKEMAFAISPTSESGDWYKEHLYYLDNSGKVFAYLNKLNFANGICTDGVLRYNQLFYYDGNFTRLKQESKLLDKDGTDMSDKGCEINYTNPVREFRTLNEILSGEGIYKIW